MKYTDLEYEIFARQFILKEFSEESLAKLKKLKITIVGLGGIGCPLSQYLISSGIKNLTIIDGDKIEKSNLNRQLLYSIEEIGEFKADIAKIKLLQTNPNSNIISYSQNLYKNNLRLLSKSSLIIDTTDNWNTSKLINNYCVNNSIGFIFASTVAHDIQVCYFPNKKNHHICLNCLFPNKDDAEIPRCETIGISVALIILALVFGSVTSAFIPVVMAIVAIFVAIGMVSVVGQVVDLNDFVTNIMTMMGLAVGIDYCLFILSR